jgi:hypothetical protein
VGFEPTVRLPVRLISSQVPSTAQPPFQVRAEEHSDKEQLVEDCVSGGVGATPHAWGPALIDNSETRNRDSGIVSTLIHLLAFGIGFPLAKELVVIGDLVHQDPDKTDDVWPHGVEPLGGFDKEQGGAQEPAGGEDAETDV